MKEEVFTISDSQGKMRLDQFVVEHAHNVSRVQVQELITHGYVDVDGKTVYKSSLSVLGKKEVAVRFPYRRMVEVVPQPDIVIPVLYEDEDCVVVDKPAGLVVHPAPGNWDGTVLNALFGKQVQETAFADSAKDDYDRLRIGLVHRLDKDTSGVLLIAKHERAKMFFSEQFKQRTVAKRYRTLVEGVVVPVEGTIDASLGRDPYNRKRMAVVSEERGGKYARTGYRLVCSVRDAFSLVDVDLFTGRTHQIRVHFSSIGHPVVGDLLYGQRDVHFGIERQALHAWQMTLVLLSGEEQTFVAPLPGFLREDSDDISKVWS